MLVASFEDKTLHGGGGSTHAKGPAREIAQVHGLRPRIGAKAEPGRGFERSTPSGTHSVDIRRQATRAEPVEHMIRIKSQKAVAGSHEMDQNSRSSL